MSGTQSKITWHADKQENRFHNEEKTQPSEAYPWLTQTSKDIEDLNNAINLIELIFMEHSTQ